MSRVVDLLSSSDVVVFETLFAVLEAWDIHIGCSFGIGVGICEDCRESLLTWFGAFLNVTQEYL